MCDNSRNCNFDQYDTSNGEQENQHQKDKAFQAKSLICLSLHIQILCDVIDMINIT
jgi:hypothetical protein